MGSLVDKLISVGAAMGLAGCVAATNQPELKETAPVRTSTPFVETIIEIPAQVDYEKIGWDRAYFTAGTINGCDDPEIHLFYLRLESDLGDKRTRVIRVLSDEELIHLGIQTRSDLTTYLKGKAKESSGYIGPNMFI